MISSAKKYMAVLLVFVCVCMIFSPLTAYAAEEMCIRDRNKTLTSMPTTQFSGAVVSYNASLRKVTAKDFIQDNLLMFSLIVGIFIFVVLCIILDSLRCV